MFKYIVTYKFGNAEDNSQYQKRINTFFDFCDKFDNFEVSTTSTIIFKSEEEIGYIISSMEKYMNDNNAKFLINDNLLILIFEDTNAQDIFRYVCAVYLNDGKLDNYLDLDIWFSPVY